MTESTRFQNRCACGPFSLRAFDASHEMVDADLADGSQLEGLIELFFANRNVDYLQGALRQARLLCRAHRAHPNAPSSLLPLNGGGRFGRNIVSHAVDTAHFVHDPRRNALQQFVRETCPNRPSSRLRW